MSTLEDVHAHGAFVVSRGTLWVTASDDTLCAWRHMPAGHFVLLARRAGGASLYASALDLQHGARLWLEELIRTGRA